jgi:hypothetical protein
MRARPWVAFGDRRQGGPGAAPEMLPDTQPHPLQFTGWTIELVAAGLFASN